MANVLYPIAVAQVQLALVFLPIAVEPLHTAVAPAHLATNPSEVIFPAISSLDEGLEIQIPTFHPVLNIFISVVVREVQFR